MGAHVIQISQSGHIIHTLPVRPRRPRPLAMQTHSLYAAIDLGSNSFRLEIGQMDAGQLRRV